MCLDNLFGGKPAVDKSAELARQQEDQRQARIRAGEGAIDTAFAQFDNPFFDQFTSSYLAANRPQLDEQFGTARTGLREGFARNGMLNSSAAADKFGDLSKKYTDAAQGIAGDALGATNQLRTTINNQRNQLSGLNAAAADPSAAARSAASAVGAVSTAPQVNPITNVFAGVIDGINANQAGRKQALPPGYAQFFAPGAYSTPSNKVVR